MYVVVTGGSGFLGGHVAEELLRRGHAVGILDVVKPRQTLLEHPNCRYLPGDLTSLPSMTESLAEAGAVCHLAGVGDVYHAAREPFTAAQRNVVGTANVCEAAV